MFETVNNDELRARAVHLDAEIVRAQARLDELIAQRHAVQTQLDSIVYPVLSLPPEITSEIFVDCLFLEGHPIESLRFNYIPLLVTSICRTWRKIALSTPQLWNMIYLYMKRVHDMDATGQLVDTWLSRSGQCPLTLWLDSEYEYNTLPSSSRLLAAFATYAIRFVDIRLHLSSKSFPSLGKLVFPRLTSLDLRIHDTFEDNSQPITLFSVAPLLRSASFSFNTPPSAFCLPWHQLTKLDCFVTEIHQILDLLSRTSSLVECDLIDCVENLDDGAQPLAHSTLRFLSLEYSLRLLAYLTLPELRVLNFDNPQFDHDHYPPLQSFLTRSACSLDRLEIISHGPGLHQILQAIPSLLELRLYGEAEVILHQLSVDFTCLPNLRRLELWAYDPAKDGEMLLDALEMRWSSVGRVERLRSVQVRFFNPPWLPSPLLERFRSLASEGMEIDFEYLEGVKLSWL